MASANRGATRAPNPSGDRAITATPTEPARPSLTTEEERIVTRTLAKAATLNERVDLALSELGSLLFTDVFGGDSTAVIEHRGDNPVWVELLRRAGGRTLRFSDKTLTQAALIAAYDRRLADDRWTALDPARKSLLLPLRDDKALRAAADHVLRSNLSYRATQAYVATLRAALGEPVERRESPARLRSAVRTAAERLAGKDRAKRIVEVARAMDDGDRAAFSKELKSLAKSLAALAEKIDK